LALTPALLLAPLLALEQAPGSQLELVPVWQPVRAWPPVFR